MKSTERLVAERKNILLFACHYPEGDPQFINRIHVVPIGGSAGVNGIIFAAHVHHDGKLTINPANHTEPLKLLEAVQFICDYEGEIIEIGREIWK